MLSWRDVIRAISSLRPAPVSGRSPMTGSGRNFQFAANADSSHSIQRRPERLAFKAAT
jgi:hypothetical protein